MLTRDLSEAVSEFGSRLDRVRSSIPDIPWYPYGSLNNIGIFDSFINSDTVLVPEGGAVLDIGPADGDIGFLFHSLGCDVDFLDNASTNFNDCLALKETSKQLGHKGRIIECDMDLGFELDRDYDLAVFLGALYHLRNPALPLIRLAQHCKTMVLSTRIASHLPNGQSIRDVPVAYLLETREANDDPTNWWIFSELGLTRLLKRCGWNVLASKNFGAVKKSDPVTGKGDERRFVYCERVTNYTDLLKHHDF
jgi:hypothetical protein